MEKEIKEKLELLFTDIDRAYNNLISCIKENDLWSSELCWYDNDINDGLDGIFNNLKLGAENE